jgi:hypothetical protein
VLALVLVSSCLFPDLGPLSGDDAGNGDATSDVKGSDVSSDVTNDAALDGPPSDAGLDVKTSPCATKHTFCDDFDDGAVGATWDNIDNGVGGTLSQTTNAVSAPYALEAKVPSGPGHPYAMLQKYFPAAAHVHFECDLIIVGSQATNMEIDYFDFSFTPSGYVAGDFNLERNNPGGTVEEISQTTADASSSFHDDNMSEELGSWKHLVVDIDFTKASFTMTVDGQTVDAMSMTPPLSSAQATLSVGATYTGGLTAQWSVITDNVVVDLQ